jgi:CTP-dependent riboflavin kinase
MSEIVLRGCYQRGLGRSGLYLRKGELAEWVNENLSELLQRTIVIFPGTLNVKGNEDHVFEMNEAVRRHGLLYPQTPMSLPFWMGTCVLELLDEDDRVMRSEKVGILYPIAKSDTKGIEIISDINFQKAWDLEYEKSRLQVRYSYE